MGCIYVSFIAILMATVVYTIYGDAISEVGKVKYPDITVLYMQLYGTSKTPVRWTGQCLGLGPRV